MTVRGRSKESVMLAGHLESALPVQLIATLTAARIRAQQGFDTLFSEWVSAIQRRERKTIAFVRADELRPQRHIHALLIAARPLSVEIATFEWQVFAGSKCRDAALVEPYQGGGGGLAYVLKRMNEPDGDVMVSGNLARFGRFRDAERGTMKSAERRQCRRIARQAL
jgi:hypothetical protein